MGSQLHEWDVLQQVMDGCKRKYKFNKRRLSYTHPLFRELFDAFSALKTEESDRIRKEIWRTVAEKTREEIGLGHDYFQQLDTSDESMRQEDLIQIRKDLQRSGAMWNNVENRDEWIQRLEKVLRAYAVHDKAHGYTQGMNLFASEFLYITQDEECAFWLSMHVCENIAPGYHTKDMAGLKRDIWVLKQLLEQYFPDLVAHFRACEVDNTFTFIFIGPLLSLFASVLPPLSLDSLYDVLLTNGVTTIFATWLSFFKVNQLTFLEQKDANSLMDALNLALESWGSQTNFQRSLLQWCVVLDASSISDFRQNAPMHWLNMDAVLKIAQETPLQVSHNRFSGREPSSSSSLVFAGAAGALSPRILRRKTPDKSHDKDTLSPSLQVSSAHPSSTSTGATAALSSPSAGNASPTSSSSSPLVLTVVWIAFNLRNPLNCHAAEEYRQAAVNTCREILKMNGHDDILTTQKNEVLAGHPTSSSTLLPTSLNMERIELSSPFIKLSQKEKVLPGDSTEEEECEEESDVVAEKKSGAYMPRPRSKHRLVSPGTRKKQLVIETKQEMDAFSDSSQSAQLWRAPESFSSIEALLDGLLSATSDLLANTSEENPVYPLLERLWLCLKTTRGSMPVTHHTDVLLEELMQSISVVHASSHKVHWRKKIANVFRGSKKNPSSSSSFPSTSSSISSSVSSSQKNAPFWQQGTVGSANFSLDASSHPPQQNLSRRKLRKAEKQRQMWRHFLVVLLLATKTHLENQSIGLYDVLDTSTSKKICALFEFLENEIKSQIDAEIAAKTEAGASSLSSSNVSATSTTGANPVLHSSPEQGKSEASSSFQSLLNYELQAWSLDGSATLFAEQWIRARKADLRNVTKTLAESDHRRFASHTGTIGFYQPCSDRTIPPPLPPRPSSILKSRSRSAPVNVVAGLPAQPHTISSDIKLLRDRLLEQAVDFASLTLYQVRRKALVMTQEQRALYWALRSNYHIVLEMSKLADLIPETSLATSIRELASLLHSTTYEQQARLCEAVRMEYITSQLEMFASMLPRSGVPMADQPKQVATTMTSTKRSQLEVGQPSLQQADGSIRSMGSTPSARAISSTTTQVLLDDLEDQIKLVKTASWRKYLEEQFETMEGDLIL